MKQRWKIIVAPDSFKGSLSAAEAAAAIAQGIRQGLVSQADAEILCIPIADGGEGTLEALVPEQNRIAAVVSGPLSVPVQASYGMLEDTAVIEMASAAGLTLVPAPERSAGRTTTYGVGELIVHALDRGCRRLLLTVGGSATNDGGCGMLAALGARFYDGSGVPFLPTGEGLCRIASIDLSGLDSRLSECRITVATDVKNPLTGESGATMMYARQKGADSEELLCMERGMRRYAGLLQALSGRDVSGVPGCGAGGGISAPLLALFQSRVESGIEAVLKTVRFRERLRGASLVITGEGKIDSQSLCGKAVSGVSGCAAEQGVPVYCFAGCVGGNRSELLSMMGLAGIETLSDREPDPSLSMLHAARLLRELAADFTRNGRLRSTGDRM